MRKRAEIRSETVLTVRSVREDPDGDRLVAISFLARNLAIVCYVELMACVERLREELMESLGFEVEASAAARGWSAERAESGSRRGGKGRRRLSQEKVAVQIGVPDPQALGRGQEEREERGFALYGAGRMADTRTRPHSAKLFRASSRCRGRPTSASSARCPVGRGNANGGFGANKDMEVLLEICRDQGRTGSLDPADFDSRSNPKLLLC